MEKSGREQADDRLQKQLIDESPTAIYVAAHENDELLYLNQAGAKILRVDVNEIHGKKCYEFLMRRNTHCPFCHKYMLKDEQS